MIRDNTTVTVRRNTFMNNRAVGPQFALGGGACVYFHCTVTFDDNVFDGCVSQFNGGGLYAVDSVINITGNDATDNPSSAWFLNCTATNFGGGMHLRRCTGTISRLRISSCGAGSFGGGAMYETCGLTISESFVGPPLLRITPPDAWRAL
jgi:hypothetical protein